MDICDMRLLTLICSLLLFCTCDPAPAEPEVVAPAGEAPATIAGGKHIDITEASVGLKHGPNPAAPGFDLAGSDERAIAIADSVVAAHGGRAAYDDSRYFRWNFFGARTLYWDKQEQRVRIEIPQENAVYLLNYGGTGLTGRVRVKGDEITHPDSLALYLGRANSMFLNDSYWLVQQFKLKDSGVTLKYIDQVRLDPLANRPSHVLDLTFDGVGDTPANRYRLFVDGTSYRINTWQFFRDAKDEKPTMETPWLDYKPYNGLWLSGDRGGRFVLGDIAVSNKMLEKTFTEF